MIYQRRKGTGDRRHPNGARGDKDSSILASTDEENEDKDEIKPIESIKESKQKKKKQEDI